MLIFDNEQRIRWGSTSSYWRPCSSLPVLLLAPMLLPVILLLLLLLLLALLHYECCNMMSLLLLFFLLPCRKSLPVPVIRPFTFPHAWKFWSLEPGQVSLQGPAFYGREECKMSSSRDRKTFPAFGNAKSFLPGIQRIWIRIWKRSIGGGKNHTPSISHSFPLHSHLCLLNVFKAKTRGLIYKKSRIVQPTS